jgi:N-acetylneuraminate lyase
MKNQKFEGIMPAIFSVYDENLKVKRDTMEKLVSYQLDAGACGFYVGGNTGECTVLPAQLRKEILETVIDANAGRGSIIAHIGAGHLDETLDLLDHACAAGVDAVASLPPSLTPYYDLEETLNYYRILAERSTAPVVAYVTGVLNGDPVDFAKALAEIPNVSGIKLTIPNYFAFGRVTDAVGDKLSIWNGPDETLLCGLAMGADGGIGTTYNFLPRLVKGIYDDFKAARMADARDKQAKLDRVIAYIAAGGSSIARWKAVMTTMGYDMGHTIAPRILPSAEEIKAIESALKGFGFFDWF